WLEFFSKMLSSWRDKSCNNSSLVADAAGVQAPQPLVGVMGIPKPAAQMFKRPSSHPYRRKLREQVGAYPSSRTGGSATEDGISLRNLSRRSPTIFSADRKSTR